MVLTSGASNNSKTNVAFIYAPNITSRLSFLRTARELIVVLLSAVLLMQGDSWGSCKKQKLSLQRSNGGWYVAEASISNLSIIYDTHKAKRIVAIRIQGASSVA